MKESEETPSVEAKSHPPAFLKKAEKLAEKEKGTKIKGHTVGVKTGEKGKPSSVKIAFGKKASRKK